MITDIFQVLRVFLSCSMFYHFRLYGWISLACFLFSTISFSCQKVSYIVGQRISEFHSALKYSAVKTLCSGEVVEDKFIEKRKNRVLEGKCNLLEWAEGWELGSPSSNHGSVTDSLCGIGKVTFPAHFSFCKMGVCEGLHTTIYTVLYKAGLVRYPLKTPNLLSVVSW